MPEYNTIVAGHRETGLWEVAREQTSVWRLFTLGELRYLPRLTILILNTVVFKSRSALRTFLQRATQVHEPGGHLFFATVGLDGQLQRTVGQVPEPGPWLYLALFPCLWANPRCRVGEQRCPFDLPSPLSLRTRKSTGPSAFG